jgi:hypothetical protein
MGNTIDTAFIEQYDADVKLAYQRQGSLLRNTVRQKNNVLANKCYFQKLGKGAATAKGRNGDVVPMNPEHSNVNFTPVDRYAPEYVDHLDELKTNIDERGALVKTGVYALGRETDDQIITQLDTSTNYAGNNTDGLTKAKIQTALFDNLLGNDVPDDGDITCVIGWKQWSQLLDIEEFKNADYVGSATLPWIGNHQAKRWLNVLWIPHSGLTLTSSVRFCHMYHRSSVGHGTTQEVKTMIDWIPIKVAWLVNACMSMGACLIDTTGVTTLRCKE